MVTRPIHMNPYEFVLVSALRALQLKSGSVPRVDGGHAATTTAQLEVAHGHVTRADGVETVGERQCVWQL
jgi:DNA-directed RNA polymerase subunit K/omega